VAAARQAADEEIQATNARRETLLEQAHDEVAAARAEAAEQMYAAEERAAQLVAAAEERARAEGRRPGRRARRA
jgi:hypothetical protein